MKKIIIPTVIALLSFSVMAEDRKVAVFHPAGNANNNVKDIVREQISSVIVKTDGYTVLERQLIDRVLSEHRIQVGGLINESDAVKMGQLMGANFAVVSSITPLDRNLYISVKLIDVQTARIIEQSTGQTQSGTDDLLRVAERLTKEILGGVPIPVPESKPVIVISTFSGYRGNDWKNKTKEYFIKDNRFDVTEQINSPLVKSASKAYIVRATSKQTKRAGEENVFGVKVPTPEEIEVNFNIVDAKTGKSYISKTVTVTIGKLTGENTRELDSFIYSTANQLIIK